MAKIEVFFANGNRAKFELDKVSFQDGVRNFNFFDAPCGNSIRTSYTEVLKKGAIVNWAAVSFIRAMDDKEDGE